MKTVTYESIKSACGKSLRSWTLFILWIIGFPLFRAAIGDLESLRPTIELVIIFALVTMIIFWGSYQFGVITKFRFRNIVRNQYLLARSKVQRYANFVERNEHLKLDQKRYGTKQSWEKRIQFAEMQLQYWLRQLRSVKEIAEDRNVELPGW